MPTSHIMPARMRPVGQVKHTATHSHAGHISVQNESQQALWISLLHPTCTTMPQQWPPAPLNQFEQLEVHLAVTQSIYLGNYSASGWQRSLVRHCMTRAGKAADVCTRRLGEAASASSTGSWEEVKGCGVYYHTFISLRWDSGQLRKCFALCFCKKDRVPGTGWGEQHHPCHFPCPADRGRAPRAAPQRQRRGPGPPHAATRRSRPGPGGGARGRRRVPAWPRPSGPPERREGPERGRGDATAAGGSAQCPRLPAEREGWRPPGGAGGEGAGGDGRGCGGLPCDFFSFSAPSQPRPLPGPWEVRRLVGARQRGEGAAAAGRGRRKREGGGGGGEGPAPAPARGEGGFALTATGLPPAGRLRRGAAAGARYRVSGLSGARREPRRSRGSAGARLSRAGRGGGGGAGRGAGSGPAETGSGRGRLGAKRTETW